MNQQNQDVPNWCYNFKQTLTYQDYQLKGLRSFLDYYPADSASYVTFVDEEEFYLAQDSIIPLFVESGQGIHPYIPKSRYPQLEGQKIAWLKAIEQDVDKHQLMICRRDQKLYQEAVFGNVRLQSLQEKIDRFNSFSGQEKLAMFHKMIDGKESTVYDELLNVWWHKRY